MGSLSIWHWLIVLVVVAMVFGTKKLRNIGSDLGSAVKGFKDGMKEANSEADTTTSATTAEQAAQRVAAGETIDVQVKEKATSRS